MRKVPERSCGRHEFHVKRRARGNSSAKNKTRTGAEMTAVQDANEGQWAKWRSVADLYHAFFTGLILTVVARRGTADAAEFVFRVFRRQQQERFLPGLEKLGLAHLPPAVAAAQYHYLSNWIGGVHVEYMYETDAKAWVRYPPPRWIWRGTAICGVPGEVSRAMLRGWHANNGVALGDLRLGFVCTKQRRRRAGRPRRLLSSIRSSARARSAAGVRAASRGAVVRSSRSAGLAGRQLAKAAAGKSLPQLRDGICEDGCTRDGASVRT
jgi:hypothetical protein